MAGIDQLHLGGRAASRRLMALAGWDAGQPPNKGDGPRLDAFAGAGTGSSGAARLLDLGCGTGGASRLLARELGYEVVGVDIIKHFKEKQYSDASMLKSIRVLIFSCPRGAEILYVAFLRMPVDRVELTSKP